MKQIYIAESSSPERIYVELEKASKDNGEPCKAMVRGEMIYSLDTLDTIYLKCYHMTQAEYEEKRRKELEEINRRNQEHEKRIPELMQMYRDKARGIIPTENLDIWDEVVPIQLKSIYKGQELPLLLELIAELNDETISQRERLYNCKEKFDAQQHSGSSARLVFDGLEELHPLGKKAVKYIERLHIFTPLIIWIHRRFNKVRDE